VSAFVATVALLGLLVGVVVLLVVVTLLNRVLRPIREIKRYADDTLDAGLGIARHLDGIDEAVRTRDLAVALPGLAASALGEGAKSR
jgi:hypothetical protein